MKRLVFIAKGKRGIVYKARYKGRVCAVKLKHPKSQATGNLEKEYKALKLLNRYGIGPKAYGFEDGKLFMELIEGEPIARFIEHGERERLLDVIRDVLKQLRVLDKIGYNKMELVNPYKHIIVTDNRAVLIDFERIRSTKKPKNITQFLTYLTKEKVSRNLAAKGIFIIKDKIRELGKRYKANPTEQNFRAILDEVLQKGFQARVYYATMKIPRGKVTSYKGIAEYLGTKAYRAVGNALNKNPFAPLVPCHRVVANNLELGGFSSGLAKKIKLLKGEGVRIKDGKVAKEHFVRLL
ncbi:hypothetical protein DRJ48_05380 [Candidatus Woesearchaeota archaeon]|nr:MAG: hypothetical protein DRJ48_05380 [Candidatus Woesearchaeota archaeon]